MIRPINLKDTNDIHLINKNALGYDFPIDLAREKLASLLSDTTHHFLIGFEDVTTHKLVGYLHAEVYDTLYSRTLFNVLGLAVANERQHHGIGRQLMTSLEKEAVSRNISGVRLNSGINREEAHQFYESLGFSADKNQKRYLKWLSN